MGFKNKDPRIKILRRWAGGYLVRYPVDGHYNGSPSVYVDPPVRPPDGWTFTDIAIGLELNVKPPLATMLMERIESPE